MTTNEIYIKIILTNLEPDGRSYIIARSADYKKKKNAERSAERCYLIAGHPGHLLWVPLYHTAYETMTNERHPNPNPMRTTH